MLLLGSKTFTVDGITVGSDHADPNQFWYFPAPVVLAKREDGEPQFTLIKYRPEQVAAGVKGGGFLMFTAALPLDPGRENELRSKIAVFFPEITEPRLSPVPFDEGSVQCVALDLQGPGGTAAPTPKEGAFQAVEKILGATTPSLLGDNNALFSLTVSQEGATVLEAAFENELQPVGVIYQLKYTAVRPALDVKITADLKRAYDAFSIGLTGQVYWVSAGIDATWAKLVQDGVIKVQVINLAPNDAENKEKENWALNLFKDHLLSEWFTPGISPPAANPAEVGFPDLPKTPTSGDPKKTPDNPKTVGNDPKPDPKGDPKGDPKKPDPKVDPKADPKADGGKANAGGDPKTDKSATDVAKTAGKDAVVAAGKDVIGALDPKKKVDAAKGDNPANASPSASPFGVALRLKYINEQQKKTVTVEYNRMDAVQRTYAPQGYFGALLSGTDRDKHVLDVDLDDPFFRKLSVTATPPRDFAAIALRSVHVDLDYGDPDVPTQHKHGELMFDVQHQAPQAWEIYKNPSDSREFRYAVDYHFDSQSEWDAEKATYSFPATTTENADLTLNPFEFLTFAAIRITPGRIDWNLIDYIELDLDYASASGWKASKHVELRQGAAEQWWKLRLLRSDALSYTRRVTHHLKDGTTIAHEPIVSTVPAVVVEDPFYFLNVQVEPLLDPSKTSQAFLDVKYGDDSYAFDTNLTFAAGTRTPARLRIPVLDLSKHTWSYRVTLVGAGNQITRGAWTDTDQNEIFVTDSGVQ